MEMENSTSSRGRKEEGEGRGVLGDIFPVDSWGYEIVLERGVLSLEFLGFACR